MHIMVFPLQSIVSQPSKKKRKKEAICVTTPKGTD